MKIVTIIGNRPQFIKTALSFRILVKQEDFKFFRKASVKKMIE